jgi:hypothetical protein
VQVRSQEEIDEDRRRNEAARREMMRIDGQRSPGENIEQVDRLIKALQELSRGMPGRSS